MKVEAYLFFNGRCDEALAFYKKALGAQVEMLMRFKESPDQSMVRPGLGDKIMHASFTVGQTRVMASDGQCNATTRFDGFSLSISVGGTEEAQRYFQALSDGGKVHAPLTKTFFSPMFGMVEDRFGVTWMVLVAV